MNQISQQDVQELKKQGYSYDDINQAILDMEEEELQSSYQGAQNQSYIDPRTYSQQSSFAVRPDDNLVKWQLELNDILEKAEHILRGDIPKYKDGILIWQKNENPKLNSVNEYGIQEIMKILVLYINRNTILSDYDNKEINYKVLDFGRRLNNFIFMRYDEIGMDTEDKRKNYEILVGEVVDLVHSAYKRALHGGERRSLREMIQVSQNTQSYGQGSYPMNMPQVKERSYFNPMRWLKGRNG
jgi:hypothetical protein